MRFMTSTRIVGAIALSLTVGQGIAAGDGQTVAVPISCESFPEQHCGNVFTTERPPVFLVGKDGGGADFTYEVKDWRNAVIAQGVWKSATSSRLELKGLPLGHHTLEVKTGTAAAALSIPFGIVQDPERRTISTDGYFAMDSAQSWLARRRADAAPQPQDGFTVVSDYARLAGLPMVRERMSWGQVESVKGTVVWGDYMRNAELLSAHGVQVLGMFHDAPIWAKGDPKDKLPSDLMAVREFSRRAANDFKGKMTAWEFWNEEDTAGFAPEPVWDFAAAMKAASLGFKEGDPDAKVLIGGLCRYPLSNYFDLVLKNGCGDYFDLFNFHIYSFFPEYANIIADLRATLARNGHADMPIWITENGSRYEGQGRDPSPVPGKKEHNLAQQMILAEFAVKAPLLLRSLGVQRDFHFVLPAYNEREGEKVWGALKWDYSAKPMYTAFSNLTAQLGNAAYLGTYAVAEGVRGFLFEQPDGSQTLVFWSESDLDTISKEIAADHLPSYTAKSFERKCELAVPRRNFIARIFGSSPPPLRLIDVMGGACAVEPVEGKFLLTAIKFPAYLHGLSGLKPTTAAPAPSDHGKHPVDDRTIVLKATLGENLAVENMVSATLEGPKGTLLLDIYNFDNAEKTGRLENLGDAAFEGIARELRLPPLSKTRVELVYDPGENPQSLLTAINLGGTFNGRRISSLRIPVTLDALVERACAMRPLDISAPARWRKNSAGDMEIAFDEKEKAIKFHTKFGESKDYWVYPELPLKLPEETLAGAVGISFEIKAVQKDGGTEFSTALLMALRDTTSETGERVDFGYRAPGVEWQTRKIIFERDAPAGLNPADIKMLRLGMNPRKDELTYWVRDVRVYYKK